jgi:hypothetical protein
LNVVTLMADSTNENDTFMDDVPSEEEGTSVTEYDITASPNDFNVLTISSYLDAGSIVIPAIQRFYTWDIKRASKFIESLVLGLPVPQIFLFEEQRNRLLILDGQQRLLSIYFFTKMRFPRPSKRAQIRSIFSEHKKIPDELLQDETLFTDFRINLPEREDGKRSTLHGLNYKSLGEFKQRLELRPVRVVIIKQNEPKDENSSIKEIYNRLNTGGVNLRPQEMRANLYESNFYNLLYRLNKLPTWRGVIGKPDEDDYMRDVELLLRSFAMLVDGPNYQPSMSRFLDRFSAKVKKFSPASADMLEAIFKSFLNAISELPSDAFISEGSGRFSIALFEATLFGVARSIWAAQGAPNIPPIPANKIALLAADPDFSKFLQEGTTKQVNVSKRLEIAQKLFGAQA